VRGAVNVVEFSAHVGQALLEPERCNLTKALADGAVRSCFSAMNTQRFARSMATNR
jgi:hypothetical protein